MIPDDADLDLAPWYLTSTAIGLYVGLVVLILFAALVLIKARRDGWGRR